MQEKDIPELLKLKAENILSVKARLEDTRFLATASPKTHKATLALLASLRQQLKALSDAL